MKLFTCFT